MGFVVLIVMGVYLLISLGVVTWAATPSSPERATATDHPLYVALGDTAETRGAAYRALFRYQLEDVEIAEIRTSLNKGLAGGAERFKDQIETVLARSVRPGQAGCKKTVAGLNDGQESLNLRTSVERHKPFDTPAARTTQGERVLTKLETTPFVLSSAVFARIEA